MAQKQLIEYIASAVVWQNNAKTVRLPNGEYLFIFIYLFIYLLV